MKKILASLFVVIGMTSLQANAFDWTSALNFLNRASQEQEVQAQKINTLSDIEKQMATIDKSVQTSFMNIVSELSGWRETRSVKSQLKSDEILLTDVISSYANTYMETNKQKMVDNIKKMSAKEKADLINNITSLAEGGQNYLVLAANGAKTATNAFRTAQKLNDVTTTITNVNKVATELRSRATTVMTMANQVKTIASLAGVTVQ